MDFACQEEKSGKKSQDDKSSEDQKWKSSRNREVCLVPMEYPKISPSVKRQRETNYKMTMERKINQAKESLKREDEAIPRPRCLYAEAAGSPLNLIPVFNNLSVKDPEKEKLKQEIVAKLKQRLQRKSPFEFPGALKDFNKLMNRFKVFTRDQSTQTYESEFDCELCYIRDERLRAVARNDMESAGYFRPLRPVFEERPPNPMYRDIGVDIPDKTFYDSSQLVYFRFGNHVYQGYTYRTMDGKIELIPRVPRGIHIDELRVEKPLRKAAEI